MSEIRERLEEIQRLSGAYLTDDAVDVLAEIHEDATKALALLPTEGEPPTDEQWEAVRQHVLGFAAYVLARGGLDVEDHKGDRAAYDATVTGACLRFSVSDESPADILKELKEKLTTPQESTEAIEWVRRAMTNYHGMRRRIGAMMWRRGETILGEEVEGLPPRESAEVERLNLPGHKCEPIADFGRYMNDMGQERAGEREWWIGRLTEPIDGFPEEKWCFHIRTPLKPEIVFGFNEADLNYLVATIYAALEYHTNPDWVEKIAASARAALNTETDG